MMHQEQQKAFNHISKLGHVLSKRDDIVGARVASLTVLLSLGIFVLVRNLPWHPPFLLSALLSFIVGYVLIRPRMPKWAGAMTRQQEQLDQALTSYQPVDASAYTKLQEETRKSGVLLDEAFERWRVAEHEALRRRSGIESDTWHFAEKR